MRNIINKSVFTFNKKFFFTANEKGSVLVVATLVLFVLSLLGMFALNTTDVEINIAANQQNWEKSFNVSEGGAKLEGTKVGYASISEYGFRDNRYKGRSLPNQYVV